jgi:predicted esterase
MGAHEGKGRRLRCLVAWGVFCGVAVGRSAAAQSPASFDDCLAPSLDGALGAWLVAGPLDAPRLPEDVRLSPALDAPITEGAGTRWRLAGSSGGGPIDLSTVIDARSKDRLAYAAGVLRVEHGGRHLLSIGSDDGVAVFIDGVRVFSRDEVRSERDDEDLVALDLSPGEHAVVLALLRHGPRWTFRARLLDGGLQPPHRACWRAAGAGPDEAHVLAARMSSLTLDRGMNAYGYRPVLTVRFPGGAPRGVPLDVHVRLVRASSPGAVGERTALFDVDAGQAAPGERGVAPLVVTLPEIAGEEVEDDDWTLHVEVAGRDVDLPLHARRALREAAARATRALAATPADTPSLDPASLETLEYLRDRLVRFVAKGDGDVEAQLEDANELDLLSASIEQQRDPYTGRSSSSDGRGSGWRTGPMRRAYRSPADGHLSEFALYVPPAFDPTKTYPLIVALHGMNGRPMEMLMWLFGHDDPARDGDWEDRHPRRDLAPLDAIVVAPAGHHNTMYRDLGEDDVMRVIHWATARYPIDPARVTITGPSMGGIGAAACALHHPDQFAAAEPLCGYHSYLVRPDPTGRGLRPWERFIAQERSNALWAENGLYLPLYIVHGTKDLPEENSGVLIDRYEDLHYSVKHEHPILGHNVWQPTYEDLKGALWLLEHQRPMHPRAIRFKTPRTRWADDAWVHVRELSSSDEWGEVIARIDRENVIYVSTRAVAALSLDRDAQRVDDASPVSVRIDGDRLTFQAEEPIEVHRAGGKWRAGPALHEGLFKHGSVTGPVRDVFHEPILFVWGASDGAQARANEEVARAWARVRGGVRVDYPVMSDLEFATKGESIANDRALFLVGNARSNAVVRELEPDFPIRIEGDDIVFNTTRVTPKGDPGRSQLGAVFIRPNPRRPDRYVVVVEGVGALGTWRSLSLPDMLPDYAIYDEDVEPAHGQPILGAGSLRAAGFFAQDWSLAPLAPVGERPQASL